MGEDRRRTPRGKRGTIRQKRECGAGGGRRKPKLSSVSRKDVLCDTRRGRIENGRDRAQSCIPRAVVQGDVEEVAGRVVGVDHKVIVVVRHPEIRRRARRRIPRRSDPRPRCRAPESDRPGGLAVLVERKVDRPADARSNPPS